jgi:hypothetical protein
MKRWASIGFLCILLVCAGCKSLQLVSLNVVSAPVRTEYGQGQALDTAGLSLSGVYEDNKTKPVPVKPEYVSGYDPHRVGEQTVVVTIDGVVASFKVTVKPLVSLAVLTPPSKVNYKLGQDFDQAGLSVQAGWDGISPAVLSPDAYTISGYDKARTGRQTLNVVAEGKTASFDVNVVAMSLITITSPPSKSLYKAGEDLDIAGLVVSGAWPGIGEEALPVTAADISGYDKNRSGSQTLTVALSGKRASFNVTVVPMTLEITSPPQKTRYKTGESLDLTGLVVTKSWQGIGSEQAVIDPADVSGFDNTRRGRQTLTVNVDGVSARLNVTVAALVSLAIREFPVKLTYNQGEPLDLTGLAVSGT